MAHGQKRIRTVTVRLRCAVLGCAHSSGVRRLLVIGGIVLAGWLLGSAAQAHADTLPGPAAGKPGAALSAAADLTTGSATVPGVSAVPRAVTGDLTRSVCEVRCTLPVRPATALGPAGGIDRIVTDLAPIRAWSDRTDTGVSWTPRRHHDVGADAGGRTRTLVPGPSAASGAFKGGRGSAAAAASHPAPAPWRDFPAPSAPQAGAFLPAAGSTLMGGWLAHLTRTGSTTRVPRIRVPLPGAVLPPMHSATDEPSSSPD